MDDEKCCSIPLDIVNAMLIMSERIKDDICTLADTYNLHDDLNDKSSTIYSLQFANKMIEMTLKNAININK
jgi:hypothetical protein